MRCDGGAKESSGLAAGDIVVVVAYLVVVMFLGISQGSFRRCGQRTKAGMLQNGEDLIDSETIDSESASNPRTAEVKRRPEAFSATTVYFLGGKNVTWLMAAASLFSSNIGAENLIGLAGEGAKTGMPVAFFELNACFVLILLGYFFMPVYFASKAATSNEYIAMRFNAACRTACTVNMLVGIAAVRIASTVFAASVILESILGWNTYASAVFMLLFTFIYTVIGGLKGVVVTDTFQTVLILFGSVLLLSLSLKATGGLLELTNNPNLPANAFHIVRPADDAKFPWPGLIFGAMINSISFWCVDQPIVQRLQSSKSEQHAKAATVAAGFLKLFPLFGMVIPGIAAAALWPKDVACNFDDSYTLLMTRLLPSGLTGLLLACLLAASMSSLSSLYNSAAYVITIDIYKRLRPNTSDKMLVKIGQLAAFLLVVISLCWLPMLGKEGLFVYGQTFMSCSSPPVSALFLCAVFSRRVEGRGAFTGLIYGQVIGFARFLATLVMPDSQTGFFLFDMNYLYFAVVSFLSCVAVMYGVSFFHATPPKQSLRNLTFFTIEKLPPNSENRDDGASNRSCCLNVLYLEEACFVSCRSVWVVLMALMVASTLVVIFAFA